MSRSYKTEGIIIKSVNWGEADRILTIFSKHSGKIRVVAKGVRKVTSRKGGSLSLFNQASFFLAQGKSLDILTEVDLIESFRIWRKNLQKVTLAYYFCELVDRLTAENQANRRVYQLLADYLNKLAQNQTQDLDQEFGICLLSELGFGSPPDKTDIKSFIEQITERRINAKTFFNLTGKE